MKHKSNPKSMSLTQLTNWCKECCNANIENSNTSWHRVHYCFTLPIAPVKSTRCLLKLLVLPLSHVYPGMRCKCCAFSSLAWNKFLIAELIWLQNFLILNLPCENWNCSFVYAYSLSYQNPSKSVCFNVPYLWCNVHWLQTWSDRIVSKTLNQKYSINICHLSLSSF